MPIPDPSTWEPAATGSYQHPAGLQPGDTYHVMFATSFQTALSSNPIVPPDFPRFGGLDAADWTVTYAAASAGLPGVPLPPDPEPWNFLDPIYQSVLSINGNNARDRISIVAPIYNTNGDLLANDAADLWDGAIQTPVGYDEQGNVVSGSTKVWTGTDGLGSVHAGETCDCWDNPTGNVFGRIGNVMEVNDRWIDEIAQACDCTARLYGISPAITVAVPEPSSSAMIVTGGLALLLFVFRKLRRRR